MITPDSETLRLEKRQRGLQRVATAINDLSIYGIYPTNFPKLIQVLEHAKDHIKAEILATKKRMVEKSELIIEEVYTDPLKTETQIESDKINDEYIKKGI
ncbi:MAG: hypothetical protein HOA67_01685 [Candidatus Marinimicrobia bacterium]|jgi:hypothetical protein|nr:hypothetical protein [Candidatus Neomarinimicrobiota bacterium]